MEKSRIWPEEGTRDLRSVKKSLIVDKKACWDVLDASAVSREVVVSIFNVCYGAFSAYLHL